MNLNQIFIIEFLGNSIQDYACFIGAILLGLIFKKLISKYLSELLFKIIKTKNTDLGADKFNELLIKPISLCVMLSIIYLGSSYI
ncbi:MAG: mechanosensitive ion channel family protein, partial [Bacteroidota bacterium]|nr:mechanosensitive ion channel family protein [Bacteroidota bacterium]